MQLWPTRSCGFFGSGRAAEIRRRADDSHAQVGSDAHRDHVLGHLFAAAHARVVAFRDNVAQAVVDDDLDLDVWIRGQQLRELRQKDRVGRVFGRGDADDAGGLLTQIAHGREFCIDLLKARANALKQALAGLRRRDAAGGAGEQPHAEARLELANGVTER